MRPSLAVSPLTGVIWNPKPYTLNEHRENPKPESPKPHSTTQTVNRRGSGVAGGNPKPTTHNPNRTTGGRGYHGGGEGGGGVHECWI